MRVKTLREQIWNHICRLGVGAFETISGEVVNVALLILTNQRPSSKQPVTGIDISLSKVSIQEKANLLRIVPLQIIQQELQHNNPDARILLSQSEKGELLAQYAHGVHGLGTKDSLRFIRCFWEVAEKNQDWEFIQSTITKQQSWGGMEHIVYWQKGQGILHELGKKGWAVLAGGIAWGKSGVSVNQMGELFSALYSTEIFDKNVAVILPKDPTHLPAIWAFCQSPKFNEAVRQIDQALKVTNATLVKVPFDLEYWQKVADEAGPLPEPYSNDPTQWLFDGNPVNATQPLQVAVARLLGYCWPQQKADMLAAYTDNESIICLPSVAGKDTAVERLRALLAVAYGETWSLEQQEQLLAEAGFAGKSLALWLRDGFFAQHCKLFHNRPFIWHIWDGLSDGFSALVNYHSFDSACLERLIYTYLGSWMATQKAEQEAGIAGAEGRYIAATKLQKKLKEIHEGEQPYDIYARWKQLSEQPVGWQPDVNDGVRINIRPFVEAGILRNRFTINWNKDRGTNPDGTERHNDCHYSLVAKYAAQPTSVEYI